MGMVVQMVVRVTMRVTMRVSMSMVMRMAMAVAMTVIIFGTMMDDFLSPRAARIFTEDQGFDRHGHSERGNAHFAQINIIKVHQHDAINDEDFAHHH